MSDDQAQERFVTITVHYAPEEKVIRVPVDFSPDETRRAIYSALHADKTLSQPTSSDLSSIKFASGEFSSKLSTCALNHQKLPKVLQRTGQMFQMRKSRCKATFQSLPLFPK